jgi:hypothetical protein
MKLGVFRFAFVFYLTALVFAPLQAQELKFDNEALGKFGTKTFRMIVVTGSPEKPGEQEVGKMTLSAKVDSDTVALVNQTKMFEPDGKNFMKFDVDSRCSADGRLALQSMTMKVEQSDGLVMHEATGIVENDQFKYKYSSGGLGRTLEESVPSGTVIDYSLFFLVSQLPREAGKSWTLDAVLPSPTNTIREPAKQTITCNGLDESVVIGGRKLFKFTKLPEEIVYWVDEQGVLRRVQMSPEQRLELDE